MKQRHSPRAGVTLIEMLVVVVIIGLFVAIVGPKLFSNVDKAKVVAAKTQIESYVNALGQYHLDTGSYPTTEQGLAALMLETDAPYLAPVPFRGKANQPAYLRHTAEFAALLFGISYDELAATTAANSRKFFGL